MTDVHYLTLLPALTSARGDMGIKQFDAACFRLATFNIQVPTTSKVKNPPKESFSLTDGLGEMFRGFSHPGEYSFWRLLITF